MAKGDKKKVQKAVDTAVGSSQAAQDEAMAAIRPNLQQNQQYYTQAANQSFNDYSDIMGKYRDLYAEGVGRNQPGLERVNYQRPGEMNEAFNSYRNFINTGGITPQEMQDMRARGVSPIRANYQNMANEMMRQRNLQGGYSPNMGAVMTRLGAQRGQMTADAIQDVNARLAEQVQQGRQFGTSGMAGLSTSDAQLAQQAALANQQAGLEIARYNLADPRFQAASGMAQLYGTTPGQAAFFGNQTQQGLNNMLQGAGQQQNIGNMGIQGQLGVAQVPSDFQVGAGRVKKGAELAGRGMAAIGTGGASELALAASRGGRFEL